MLRHIVAVTSFAFAAMPAPAAYLDDRSAPDALIRSLYNAIENREYARAWSYFAEKPADTLEAYADGFANTQSVSVLTGAPQTDAAAGTTRWLLPVAIEATESGAGARVFAGCYTISLANPQVQDDPYRPMQIVGAKLALANVPATDALPSTCDPALPSVDALTYRAKGFFAAATGDRCNPTEEEPERYELPPEGEGAGKTVLFRFLCRMTAYNQVDSYVRWDDVDGMRLVSFAVPDLDIRYEPDSNEQKLESMSIRGYVAHDQLLNSTFDPADLSIASYEKWRGLGDAWSSGKWIYRAGRFSLVRFEADPTYDEKDEGQTVLDLDSAP